MTPNNAAHYQRALGSIPWATQTNAKRYDLATPSQPPFIKSGQGCRIRDLDNKEYIDYRCALGPILLGYRYPEVEEAVRQQMERGALFSMASPLEAEAAEAILRVTAWPDRIRFMKTGADVNACCLRLARAATGRDHLLTCGYHGYQDWYALQWPKSGVPDALRPFVHHSDYGDLDFVEETFASHGERIAAAVVIPVDWQQEPNPAYLQLLREKCDQYGALLIFDEVLTGFRLAPGGAAEYFGIQPDFSAYAKGIANGYSLSAYAGTEKAMSALDQTILTTTYAGDTLSLAAAQASMQVIESEPIHPHLFAMGKRLRQGLDTLFQERSFPARTVGVDVACQIAYDAPKQEATRLRNTLFERLYQGGIFANNEWFISYSHQEADIDETLERFSDALTDFPK